MNSDRLDLPGFFGAFLLILLLGLLQATEIVSFFGVKPNLLLAALIAMSFFIFEDLASFLALVLTSVILLKSSAGLERESLIFAVLAIGSGFLSRFLHWLPAANNLFLAGAATLIFHLAAAPKYFLDDWRLILLELVYNLIAGAIMFRLFGSWTTSSMLKK